MSLKSVYVMASKGHYKIGVSEFPQKRLHELGIGNCDIRLIYASKKLSNAYAVERHLHKTFATVSSGREWFKTKDEHSFLKIVERIVDELGETNVEHHCPEKEMMVRESGEVFTLSEWIVKTTTETEKMAYENEQLQRLVYALEFANSMMEDIWKN